MRLGVESGQPAVVCALAVLFSLVFLCAQPSAAASAQKAAALGPEVSMTEPSGGYVGRLDATPVRGPAGTPLTVTGEGFPAGQEFELVWRTVKGDWKVTIAEYHGREYTPAAYRIATVRSDAAGRISVRF